MKKSVIVLVIAWLSLVTFSFKPFDQEPWKVPDSANKMKNPTDADKASLSIGKSIYVKHCKSCHGKYGEGDGTKAGELDTFPGDFTEEEFQAQTDGAIFYKTKEGRDDMPGFKKKITDDEDYWLVINYIRTLAED